MRTFTDRAGQQWTVFEVKRTASDVRGGWTYLPTGYGDAWLCFERPLSKRRLAEFPAHCSACGSFDVEVSGGDELLVESLELEEREALIESGG